jgi:hypothetical protein
MRLIGTLSLLYSRCFGKESTSVEHIIEKLEKETQDAEWAQATLKVQR